MIDITKNVRFTRPIGVELTLLPIGRKDFSEFKKDRRSVWYGDRALQRLLMGYRAAHIKNGLEIPGDLHIDPGCVENSSPILRSWAQTQAWYEQAMDLAESAGLGWRNDWPAGGGHIHMGIPTYGQAWKLVSDMLYRPYVAWACLTPSDTCNASPLFPAFEAEFARKQNHVKQSHRWRMGWSLNGMLDVKKWCLTLRPGLHTVEWRAFDSAATWEIQSLQIALYQRYAQKVLSQPLVRIPTQGLIDTLNNSWKDLDWCVDQFKHFIEEFLELPWSEYSWLVDRNLAPRHEAKMKKATQWD
jgi:hypothetical protein